VRGQALRAVAPEARQKVAHGVSRGLMSGMDSSPGWGGC